MFCCRTISLWQVRTPDAGALRRLVQENRFRFDTIGAAGLQTHQKIRLSNLRSESHESVSGNFSTNGLCLELDSEHYSGAIVSRTIRAVFSMRRDQHSDGIKRQSEDFAGSPLNQAVLYRPGSVLGETAVRSIDRSRRPWTVDIHSKNRSAHFHAAA